MKFDYAIKILRVEANKYKKSIEFSKKRFMGDTYTLDEHRLGELLTAIKILKESEDK